MQRFGCLLLALPLCAAAQAPAPTINPNGIVRSDTSRPGMLPPGTAFSIWGHGLGPDAGCKGAALELCGVQVLLDGVPIEIEYAQQVQINARMPDSAPSRPRSRLVVMAGGRRSEPVEVRRLPDVPTIALDGVARVKGPVWIQVELSPHTGVSYPSMATPWDFGCDAFEVRKDGKLLAPLPLPVLGGVYSGPSCPGTIGLGNGEGRKSRLPLHLQYRFDQPGVYEVRLSQYAMFFHSGDIEAQSAWTPIEVLPAVPRTIGPHPQDPAEILSGFLPDLLALPDEEALSVVLEYLYHPSRRVRAYAANALYYWPDSVLDRRLMATVHSNGPAPYLPISFERAHAAELLEVALPYFSSDDPVLFQGALAAARNALTPGDNLRQELRSRLEQSLISRARRIEFADAQTINDFISVLGPIKDKRVHDLLWSFADRHIGTEQAVMAITWQQDAKDLPRLATFAIAVPADAPPGRTYAALPNVVRAQFGDAALPWLRNVLEKAASADVRIACAEELLRANDPAAFAFALDAFEGNRSWKARARRMVNDQFPETRKMSDSEIAGFLRSR